MVEVTVKLEPRELRAANFSIISAGMNWWRTFLVSVVGCALLFPGISLAFHDKTGLGYMAIIGVFFGVFLWGVLTPTMLLISYAFLYFASWSAVRNNPRALSPVTYQFSETGYSYASLVGNGDVTWSAFPKILETRAFFLLFFTKSLAYIVPKRCFADDSGCRDFRALLRANCQGKLQLRTKP